jgi:DNA-binding transcriptional LysR family regulator
MDLLNKDLNLLMVFAVIWEHRNLVRAAEKLFVSQSAVSHSLRRLRTEFDDPLFVRQGKGVAPTEYAERLAPEIFRLRHFLEEIYKKEALFDPETVERDLCLATGDYFSVTMLEKFMLHLQVAAPRVRLICQPVSNVFKLENFETGGIHLAVSAIDVELREGFYSQMLLQDRNAMCLRKKHPLLSGRTKMRDYLEAQHIVVSNLGQKVGVVDVDLQNLRKQRKVTAVVSSFFDAGKLIGATDLVLSAPSRICMALAKDYELAVQDLPFHSKTRSISMLWHARTDQDAFHVWIRELLKSLFAEI